MEPCLHEWPISLEDLIDDDGFNSHMDTRCLKCHVTLKQALIDLVVEDVLTAN